MEMLGSWPAATAAPARAVALRDHALRIWRGTGYGMVLVELDRFRNRGMRILIVAGWLCTLVLAILGWHAGKVATLGVVPLSIAANLLPTMMVLRKRHDRAARLLTGSLAVVHPVLAFYLLQGAGWNSDDSIYSFVALAALVVLCDWRPIAIAAALTVTHHIVVASAARPRGPRPGRSSSMPGRSCCRRPCSATSPRSSGR